MIADLDDVADDGVAGEGDNARTDVETLIGGNAADTLTGNSANNGLDGGPGADSLNGGAGNDYALYWSRTAPVTSTSTAWPTTARRARTTSSPRTSRARSAAPRRDTLIGGPGANNLWGSGGDDTLDGGAGADMLWGGNGIDHVTYASRTAAVSASLDNVANDGESGEGDNLYDVENLTGGAGADVLIGSASRQRAERRPWQGQPDRA